MALLMSSSVSADIPRLIHTVETMLMMRAGGYDKIENWRLVTAIECLGRMRATRAIDALLEVAESRFAGKKWDIVKRTAVRALEMTSEARGISFRQAYRIAILLQT